MAKSSALSEKLDLAATILLHLRGVLADCTVLATSSLKEPCDGEDKCGQCAPNGSLRCGVSEAMALEQLSGTDDDERSHKDSNEALDPESNAQEILPVKSIETKLSCCERAASSRILQLLAHNVTRPIKPNTRGQYCPAQA